MQISKRTKISLIQFLLLFETNTIELLLSKHGIDIDEFGYFPKADALETALLGASSKELKFILQELARTNGSMRATITPRYKFDERWDDLLVCLELDGYSLHRSEVGVQAFIPSEPEIYPEARSEDELSRGLETLLGEAKEGIEKSLESSATAFQRNNFSGSLSNARVALETLVISLAERLSGEAGGRWGKSMATLREIGFINEKTEKVICGIYGLASRGAHEHLPISEREYTLFTRQLLVSACNFLVTLWLRKNDCQLL